MRMSEPSTTTAATDLVKKQIFVRATPERAFQVFTKDLGSWWPLASHHTSKVEAETAVIEPFTGGRWFERGVDGSECDWGKVLVWEPPARLVLAWQLSSEFRPDPQIMTEVEVRFSAENGGTRVDLEHRLLRAYGASTEEMRGVFDSQGGWASLLGAFAGRVDAA
jgi:uncharacterized protein YndB with AHSA1/START domain